MVKVESVNKDEFVIWFICGGIVVGVGILFGVMFIYFFKCKCRNSEWM